MPFNYQRSWEEVQFTISEAAYEFCKEIDKYTKEQSSEFVKQKEDLTTVDEFEISYDDVISQFVEKFVENS